MEEHSKLQVEQEGLQALRRMKGTVCPVVVIGPYRSGKSFTLNQLMGVGCGEKHQTPGLPGWARLRWDACTGWSTATPVHVSWCCLWLLLMFASQAAQQPLLLLLPLQTSGLAWATPG